MDKAGSEERVSRRKLRNPRKVPPPDAESTSSPQNTSQKVAAPIKKRYRAGARALMEIREYQDSTEPLMKKAPFMRLVREICMEYSKDKPLSWQSKAIMALQEAAESYLVHLFQDACLWAFHAKRTTLHVGDIQLAQQIRGIHDELG
ncbi:uncharacterized protein LOC134900736 [Pseudophryne corroboree]|uniref:uncharacterized protein LOC134900736 n=1 Tax=Pseudophryne corroboree TaxID=495146 RepID=UPI0030817A41